MNDINKFQELIKLTLDTAKSQNNKIKMKQILEIFEDMELNDNQRDQIIEYLAANKINVVDYVKPMKTPEQKKIQEPVETDDTVDLDQADEMDFSENKLSQGNLKSINMDDEKDSGYLAQYLNELKSIRKGTKEEVAELMKKIRAGDRQAKERFIEIQLPTVAAIACEYKGKGMKAEDLIQEGNMALLQSLLELPDTCDDDAMIKYIYDYVRNSIMESLDEQQESDRIENELMEKSNHIFDALKNLEEELGHKANIHELADYMKITEDELADILELSADSIKLDNHSHNHSHQHNHEED